MNRPLRSSSLKCSQLAHLGTRLLLAISTRGALAWVLNTPTGLPDCTSRVSSSFSSLSEARIWSKHSQLRAARPIPPYTTRPCWFSATSGSRLFWIMRKAASAIQFLQCRSLPCGARITREASKRGSFMGVSPLKICVGRESTLKACFSHESMAKACFIHESTRKTRTEPACFPSPAELAGGRRFDHHENYDSQQDQYRYFVEPAVVHMA